MYTPEQEQCEQRAPGHVTCLPPAFGTVLALLACLAGAWIAAGSTGLLAHPLRRALTLIALGAALLAPGIGTLRPALRMLLTPIVAIPAAYLVMLPALPVNILAAALALAFLAFLNDDKGRNPFLAAATAVAVFGLYVLARTSIPWVWLLADRIGRSIGTLGDVLAAPLRVGATFAGLDFLLVMSIFWALSLHYTKPPRRARALCGFVAIAGGHLVYLIGLAYVPNLLAALPEPADHTGWSLARWLHEALPWNAPAVAALIHLVIAGAMVRWTAWSPTVDREPAGQAVPSFRARAALGGAALSMAILVPVIATLFTNPLDLAGKRIVFYEKGFLNWLKPTHGSYGRLSSGMYGMLPVFVESLGATSVVSPELSADDLQDADALVLLNPDKPWAEGQLDRIHDFVRQGGSLLLMGEHTEIDPNGSNRFNEVLAPTALRIRFDSATFAVGGWLHSYESLSHPITTGIPDDRNQFGVVIGASVRTRWPARPLLVGRWGWADPGDEASDRAMMGNGRYDSGELLGDVVLAAEQPLGKGRVVAFGDTSSLQNAIEVTSHVFTSRLFAYLAASADKAHPWWRQLLGVLAGAFLTALLCWRSSLARTILVVLGLAAAVVICQQITVAAGNVLPDGRATSPNHLAYIDASHLNACSGESWRGDGIGGLALTLMRNGYLTLVLPELTSARLEKAGLLISIAPTRAFTEAEIDAIAEFVNSGGLFVINVGYDEAQGNEPLLRRFGFGFGTNDSIEPTPLGHFKSPYLESDSRRVYVRFHAAWPVRCTDPDAQTIAYGRDNQPVAMLRRVGAGKVLFVGDTGFAMNKNLEQENGQPFEGLRENADFWRWLITLLHDGPMWLPPALQSPADSAGSAPAQDVPAEEVQP
ncbi:MAG: hypothetical protein JSW27_18625 [Phycisphaerales bacterium]|nr:MAG: hypothetical protein JSW27_18625 [Phycisphaerales bacterium]